MSDNICRNVLWSEQSNAVFLGCSGVSQTNKPTDEKSTRQENEYCDSSVDAIIDDLLSL
jgi:hypothetical protein